MFEYIKTLDIMDNLIKEFLNKYLNHDYEIYGKKYFKINITFCKIHWKLTWPFDIDNYKFYLITNDHLMSLILDNGYDKITMDSYYIDYAMKAGISAEEDCIYFGESPSCKCSIYPSYEKLKMECERFFAWRRRVNGNRW